VIDLVGRGSDVNVGRVLLADDCADLASEKVRFEELLHKTVGNGEHGGVGLESGRVASERVVESAHQWLQYVTCFNTCD
jgi:hypothetical protein